MCVSTYRAASITVAAVLMCGCVQKHAHVIAPSTSAVQGGIDRAQASNTQAQKFNDVARGISGRIDAKAEVIRRYWDTSK